MDPVNPSYLRWRQELATRGLVCVDIQFWNSSGMRNWRGPFDMSANPFPVGGV